MTVGSLCVAAGEHLPVGDPGGLGVGVGEPEAVGPVPSPASERWLSRMTLRPAEPAEAMILSRIWRELRPLRSALMGPAWLVNRIEMGMAGDSTIWLEKGMRMVL